MKQFSSFKFVAKAAANLALVVGLTASAHASSVLIWGSGNSLSGNQGIANWVQALGGFTTVDASNADALTLTQLNAYDRVLYFSNSSTPGQVARGDVLASFTDTGKRLVVATFSWANQGGNTLDGRFVTDVVSPYAVQGGSLYSSVTMMSNDASAFFTGVNTLSGTYHDNITLTAGAVSHGTWSDGESILTTKGNVVGVNLFPDDAYGQVGGNYRQLFINALTVNADVGEVPEPSTLLLAGVALLGFAASRRRGQR